MKSKTESQLRKNEPNTRNDFKTSEFVPANKSTILIHKTPISQTPTQNKSSDFNDSGVINPREVSDLEGSLIQLNNDEVNKDKTSGIDLRSRLHPIEISSIVVLDNLVSLKFLPQTVIPVTLQKKRLNVSMAGKGRDEIVRIVQGKTEQDSLKGGGMSRGLMSMFQKKEE